MIRRSGNMERKRNIRLFRDLDVYRWAFDTAIDFSNNQGVSF